MTEEAEEVVEETTKVTAAKKDKKHPVICDGKVSEQFSWVEEGKGEVHVESSQGMFMPNVLNTGKRSFIMLRNFMLSHPEVKKVLFVYQDEETSMSSDKIIKGK